MQNTEQINNLDTLNAAPPEPVLTAAKPMSKRKQRRVAWGARLAESVLAAERDKKTRKQLLLEMDGRSLAKRIVKEVYDASNS